MAARVLPLQGREKRISSIGKQMLIDALETVVDHGTYTYKVESTLDPNNKNIGISWRKATMGPKCLYCIIQETSGRNGYRVKIFVDNGYNPEELLAKLKAKVLKVEERLQPNKEVPEEESLSGLSDDDMILFLWELSGESLKAGKSLYIIGRRQLITACLKFFSDDLQDVPENERAEQIKLMIEEFIDADMIAVAGQHDDGEIPKAYKLTDKAIEKIEEYEEIAAQSEFFFPDPKEFLKQYKKAARYLQPRLEQVSADLAVFEARNDTEGIEEALSLITHLNDTRLLLITLWTRIRNL